MQRRRDAVIVYHAIGRVERSAARWNGFIRPERFAAQMSWLAGHRRVVDLDALLEPDASPGPPRVAITFDDGYRSVLEHGVPVLREQGFPATIFVPTKWIGARNTWDAPSDVSHELMSGDELAELARTGFAVESHGHAHIDYARSDPRTVEEDMRASVECLTELLGRPPRYLAYPYGRATAAAAADAARLGLRAAFALDGPLDPLGDFAIPRVPIVPADARPLFALKTAGRYLAWRKSAPVRAVYRAARPVVRNRWLWP
ncbi:MAG TPA: polysaccharide deacetylase family protein [Solirubrobacteraceae bacterium]|nr:polysaccharide deacetylase family protein [Solirubrobacteraceae bacterium]